LRRLTGDEHLDAEFATTWPLYDLDQATRALLAYAKKLTEAPSLLKDADLDALREAGWDDRGIYEASALISFFNFSGRLEAASGLPMDTPPAKSVMFAAMGGR
jgi:alkylhydroperoxidase family enzyme